MFVYICNNMIKTISLQDAIDIVMCYVLRNEIYCGDARIIATKKIANLSENRLLDLSDKYDNAFIRHLPKV